MKKSESIPDQEDGKQVNVIKEVSAANREEAKSLFVECKKRLFDINHWSDFSDGVSATFVLTDKVGNQKQGKPAVGDHFKIDIPGPGSSAGSGYDWVKVELVEDHSEPEIDCEWSVIKVRPSEDPTQKRGVAHFLEEKATSSFIVKRDKNIVTAEVHGRNEKPNIRAKKMSDKIRNMMIGVGAMVGFAKIQWGNLANGLLNKKEE